MLYFSYVVLKQFVTLENGNGGDVMTHSTLNVQQWHISCFNSCTGILKKTSGCLQENVARVFFKAT